MIVSWKLFKGDELETPIDLYTKVIQTYLIFDNSLRSRYREFKKKYFSSTYAMAKHNAAAIKVAFLPVRNVQHKSFARASI